MTKYSEKCSAEDKFFCIANEYLVWINKDVCKEFYPKVNKWKYDEYFKNIKSESEKYNSCLQVTYKKALQKYKQLRKKVFRGNHP